MKKIFFYPDSNPMQNDRIIFFYLIKSGKFVFANGAFIK